MYLSGMKLSRFRNALKSPKTFTINLHPRQASFVVFAREIRNPLCVITLACDMLNTGIFNVEQQKYLDMVNRAARRISRHVNTLLTEHTNNH